MAFEKQTIFLKEITKTNLNFKFYDSLKDLFYHAQR